MILFLFCGTLKFIPILQYTSTPYGLDGPGIEYRWRRDFPHPSRPALGPPNLLYKGYRVFPGGKTTGTWN